MITVCSDNSQISVHLQHSTKSNMLRYVVLLALVAVALAAPQDDVTIVRSENENEGDGKFAWAFETSDGTKAEQQGELRSGPLEDGTDGEFEVMQGSYSYVAPDGRTVLVTYTADENGYKAKTTIQ